MTHLPKIAIVGGGTASWMAAAALSHAYKERAVDITLIDAPTNELPISSALPTLRRFHERLRIGEADFLKRTSALPTLGTKFIGWGIPGQSFFHPFGSYGTSIGTVGFHHCWLRLRAQGDKTALADYCLACVAATQGRFAFPAQDANSVLSSFSYGYHFDGALYAGMLREYALARGVNHPGHMLVRAILHGEDGYIEKLELEGAEVSADLYIDCSDGLLIEQLLQTGYEDWSRWLPCNRGLVSGTQETRALQPFTCVTACDNGWRWQDNAVRGRVYCEEFTTDHDEHFAEAARFSFVNGRRKVFWNKNCVALGAAAGFLEPLEGTTLHLIQNGIARLIQLLPAPLGDPATRAEYDRLLGAEYRQIRDFLILHYHANGREGQPFWDHCRRVEIPESLAYRIALFRSRGRVAVDDEEIFFLPNWLSIFNGLGIAPRRYHPFADGRQIGDLRRDMQTVRAAIRQAAETMPTYEDFVAAQEHAHGP
jgi:tryptophan halogenase